MKDEPRASRRAGRWVAAVLLGAALVVALALRTEGEPEPPRMELGRFPEGRSFAFTVVDDTDFATVERVRPVYELIGRLGLLVTKTVWVFEPPARERWDPRRGGSSLEDPAYRDFVLGLQRAGHEIALHSVTAGDDPREITEAGYDEFRRLFGHDPRLNVFHSGNREALYWGEKRFDGSFLRRLYRLVRGGERFEGEEPDSPFYWGDLLGKRTRYVRSWVFDRADLLALNPSLPWHDTRRPDVPFWFSSANGRTVEQFVDLLAPRNVDRLVKEKGACIVYTHFASGFAPEDASGARRVDPEFERRLTALAERDDGWFVPASDLLDRLRALRYVEVQRRREGVLLVNTGDEAVESLTLWTEPGSVWHRADGYRFRADEEGRLILDWLDAERALRLYAEPPGSIPPPLDGELGEGERRRLRNRWLRTQLSNPT